MSGPTEDGNIFDVPLSDSSDNSIQRTPPASLLWTSPAAATSGPSLRTRPYSTARRFPLTRSSSETESCLSSEMIPAGNQTAIPERSTTDEPSSPIESGWTTQPTFSAPPASATEPIDSFSPKSQTFIHPVSEGGSVTWKDHSDLVFYRGKDRGPRPPTSPLAKGYKSKGPLKNFPFDKLRGGNERKAPLRKFQDEYSGKQDQTPTELVSQIVEYFVQNEDEKLQYLMDKNVKIQVLNDQIRVQEEEINTIREYVAEAQAVKNFSAERGREIEVLNQDLMDKEGIIDNLRRKIVELEDENFATQDIDTEIFVRTLMGRIVELEAERDQKGESLMTSRDADSAKQEETINDLVREVQRKETTINDLFMRINKLEEAGVQVEYSTTSQNPDRAEQERRMKSLDQKAKGRDNTTEDIADIPHEQREADSAHVQARSAGFQGPAGSIPVPSVKEMITTARDIKASLLESKVRCLLLQAKAYIDEKEYSAAGKETFRAEAILRQDLPHLRVLHGKVLYRHGKTMYEQGFLPEAIRDLKCAIQMGFDGDCTEVDGDCVQPLLMKVRAVYK